MESEQREIMNKQLLTLSILILATTSPKAAFGGPHDQDEADIRNVETRQQEAWNRHDAKAYADLFTEDADLVNVGGWRWKGRAEIEKNSRMPTYSFFERASSPSKKWMLSCWLPRL